MNVLILTPDAVGSTLLQRLITIYMQFHDYDKPVINLHELTNGLVRYHNSAFEQETLGKKDGAWGYHQSLEQIVQLLDSVDHYKTSRVAHYHIRNRKDSLSDQLSFYQYLNDNFYIISCRRHNIFEHALSWCLSKVTKKLNVYEDQEKIDVFFNLYKNGIDLDPNSLLQTLNAYRDYIDWCNNHFSVANYFYYEEHLPRIENYILNLPIFANQTQKISWKENFGISFNDWNLCHYLKSDIGHLALNQPEKFTQLTRETKQISAIDCPGVTSVVVKTQLQKPLITYLPDAHKNFVDAHQQGYDSAMSEIKAQIQRGTMISAPPIKKQTFAEKKHMIKNYHSLLKVYNQWIEQNPGLGNPLEDKTLDQLAEIESNRWDPSRSAISVSDQQNIR